MTSALFLLTLVAADQYLFTSFRGNGDTGVYLALSSDGYKWTSLNDDKPWLKPGIKGMLMRDPCVQRGPDGAYHMVWTSSWDKTDGELKIGYASSKDLIHWSEQKLIPVLRDEPTGQNAWAPELLWNPKQKQWLIFWATTVVGKVRETGETERRDRNHRMYVMTTRDFVTFSPARLFFDPGYTVIDATILPADGKYVMVFKDERLHPEKKNLRLAFSDRADGPYTGITEAITRSWVEGPSAVKIGKEYFVYFDVYRKPTGYGAVKSVDWKTWEDVTAKMSFPAGHKHGTVLKISEKTANALKAAHP